MEGDHPKIRYDAPQAPINHSLYVDSAKAEPSLSSDGKIDACRKKRIEHDGFRERKRSFQWSQFHE